METWTTIWTVVFVATIVVFAGMAVWVTIGGFQDLKAMFRDLKADREQDPGED